MPARYPLVLAAALVLSVFYLAAQAQAAALKVALLAFQVASSADTEIARDIEESITSDLSRRGSLDLIGSAIFPGPNFDSAAAPAFADWRAAGTQVLITGRIYRLSDGELITEFRLWDVAEGRYLAGQSYIFKLDRWREATHAIADQLYERLTGQSIQFDRDDRN